MARRGHRIRIAHVVQRFEYGGLQNGMVNIINGLPSQEFEHEIISLTGSTDFRRRLPDNVPVHELQKPPGNNPAYLYRVFTMLRAGRFDVLHTRNLPALESQLAGWLAGVPLRIHGEHGWDVFDLRGTRRRYRWLRRGLRAVVNRYVVVSRQLERYLVEEIGVAPAAIARICNGVDTDRFVPRSGAPAAAGSFVVGSVGRLEAVKDYLTLARAFAAAAPTLGGSARLRLVGAGSERLCLESYLADAGIGSAVEITGPRDDIPEQLRAMDVFVLPSLAEGISNTILEAMAAGLPVIATDVGGNGELIVHGETGFLVPVGDVAAIAAHLRFYHANPDVAVAHGRAARQRAVAGFSLQRMIGQYAELYAGARCSGGRSS